MKKNLLMFLAVLFILGFKPVDAGLIIFQDSNFNDAEWTAQLGFVNSSGVSFSGEQVALGGNPGSFRQTTHNWTGPGGLNILHLNSNAIFDPTVSGAITSIDYSFDLNWLNAPAGPGGVAYRLLLLQNGTFYVSNIQLVSQNAWLTLGDVGLSATDFSRHQGTGGVNPDFSGSGSPLQFGYLSGNGTSFAQSITTVSGIDNWSASVHTSNTVPEPSSLLAFLIISIGGCFVRRRAAPI